MKNKYPFPYLKVSALSRSAKSLRTKYWHEEASASSIRRYFRTSFILKAPDMFDRPRYKQRMISNGRKR